MFKKTTFFLLINILTIINSLLDYTHEKGEILKIGLGQLKSVVTHFHLSQIIQDFSISKIIK